MLHFGNKTKNCKSCVPALGFKFIVVVFVGSLIGVIALRVIELPPSVLLIEQTKKHDQNTNNILRKLNNIEKNIIAIKHNLIHVKRRLNNEN